MIYRRMGKSGLKLSAFSYGSWLTFSNQMALEPVKESLAMAYDHGVNFFDNAEVYANGKSEELMGAAIHELGWPRDSFCVSSKVFWGGSLPTQRGLSRKHITDACHAALRRLQVDYLDLFFCHRPDNDTPVEETVRAMDALVRQGKVLYWGTSEWDAVRIVEAFAVAEKYNLTPPSVEQPEYNMFHRHRIEVEYGRLFNEFGLGSTVWSPLASGILTNKYAGGIPEESRANLPGYEWLHERFRSEEGMRRIKTTAAMNEIANRLNATMAQLALAWCLANTNVSTVILGASKPSQLKENLGALAVLDQLDASVLDELEGILGNKPQPLPSF
ncbi:MAG: aldo/keto reductase [Acidobacteria bacterium]|nr:aldo/keto reductase [Acidobacteriota bacterium]